MAFPPAQSVLGDAVLGVAALGAGLLDAPGPTSIDASGTAPLPQTWRSMSTGARIHYVAVIDASIEETISDTWRAMSTGARIGYVSELDASGTGPAGVQFQQLAGGELTPPVPPAPAGDAGVSAAWWFGPWADDSLLEAVLRELLDDEGGG